MISSRNISRRQKTHTKRVYPEKKAVQLPANQGEPSMYPDKPKVNPTENRITTIYWRRYYPDKTC